LGEERCNHILDHPTVDMRTHTASGWWLRRKRCDCSHGWEWLMWWLCWEKKEQREKKPEDHPSDCETRFQRGDFSPERGVSSLKKTVSTCCFLCIRKIHGNSERMHAQNTLSKRRLLTTKGTFLSARTTQLCFEHGTSLTALQTTHPHTHTHTHTQTRPPPRSRTTHSSTVMGKKSTLPSTSAPVERRSESIPAPAYSRNPTFAVMRPVEKCKFLVWNAFCCYW
jgi:hypothetical protein